jgi:transcriptional regulator with XRE-family HTH domain|nr:MAG TPA: Helix-turn-helix XRE-family like protein [Caudoviricetes sp.]
MVKTETYEEKLDLIVSDRLKYLRNESNLTPKDVSDVLGCTQACYDQYESASKSISMSEVIKLAKFYRVSTDFILGFTDDRDILFW